MEPSDELRLRALLRGPFEEFAENFWRQHNREFDWLSGASDPRYLEVLRDVAEEHCERALALSRRERRSA